MADKPAEIGPRQTQTSRREPARSGGLTVFDRFADEMDRLFDDFGFGRRWLGPRGSGSVSGGPARAELGMWAPDVEVYQKNNELIVRADLPGLKKEDVSVEITDGDITISGERRQEQETEKEGWYRSERTYGSFCRTIALPEGAITDQAKASFKDGVLEITVPAPPQSTRGRRLDISDGNAPRP